MRVSSSLPVRAAALLLVLLVAGVSARCPEYNACNCRSDAEAVVTVDQRGCRSCRCVSRATTTTTSAHTTTVKAPCPPLLPCHCSPTERPEWGLQNGCLACRCLPTVSTTTARATTTRTTRAPTTQTTRPAPTTTRPAPATTRRPPATTQAPTTTVNEDLVVCQPDVETVAMLNQSGGIASWPNPLSIVPDTALQVEATAEPGGSFFSLGRSRVSQKIKSHGAELGVTMTNANFVQTCNFKVKLVDIEPPQLECPSNKKVTTDPGSYRARVVWDKPLPIDNSGGRVELLSSHEPGFYFPIGKTRVLYAARDESGNEKVCTFLINVKDEEAPVLLCPASAQGQTDVRMPTGRARWFVEAHDNSRAVVQLRSSAMAGVTQFPIGDSEVTVTAEDESGNTATCTFTVTIRDVEEPEISCPEDAVVENDPGLATGTAFFRMALATDNSGLSVHVTSSRPSGASDFALGQNAVTFTATDAFGNQNFCVFSVVVLDVEPPVLTCPPDVVIPTLPGLPVGQASWELPMVEDNSNASVRLTSDLNPGDIFPFNETVTVTYTGVDQSDNVANCSFTVLVVDEEDPIITCPMDVTAPTSRGLASGIALWNEPATRDNARGTLFVESTSSSGDRFPLGATNVTYVATDLSGNSASCSFTVTIVDRQTPIITCPADVTNSTNPGEAVGTAFWPLPSSSDNSGGLVTLTGSKNPGDADFPIGSTVVLYTAVDEAGNDRTCQFRVVIEDNEAPTILCPADVTVSTDPGQPIGTGIFNDVVVADNSGGFLITSATRQSGQPFVIGTTIVTQTVIDLAGNRASCTHTVTVQDNEVPMLTCPQDQTAPNDPGLPTAQVPFDDPLASDNSGGFVTFESTFMSGFDFPVGETRVVFFGTDESGNVGNCSFRVTVEDDEPPIIIGGGNAPGSDGVGMGGGAAAPGSQCAPRNCPGDVLAEKTIGVEFDTGVATWEEPMVCDNSGGNVTLVSTAQPGDRFPIGVTEVVYTATDEFGNMDVCKFTVTIVVPTIFISGRVVDADTGSAISGATVNLGPGTGSPPPPPPQAPPAPPTTTAPPRTTRPTTRPAWWPQFPKDDTTAAPTRAPTTTRRGRRDLRQQHEGEGASEPVLARHRRVEQVSNVEGVYVFEVPADPADYTVSVMVAGRMAEVDVAVQSRSNVNVILAVPNIVDPAEYQIITAWVEDSLPIHNNFDAHLQTSFSCEVFFGNDFCFDEFSDAYLNQDYRNNRNGAGPETITVFAGSTQNSIYNHFIYGFDQGSSFVGSQVQVALYGFNGLIAKVHVSRDGALTGVPEEWRFWHTLSLDAAMGTVTVVNEITCDPQLSTGSDAVLPGENGPRLCDASV